MTAIHRPTMIDDRKDWGRPNWKSTEYIIVEGTYNPLHKAGFTPADAELGKVNPHFATDSAYLFACATVIADRPEHGTWGDLQRDGRIDAKAGDLLEMVGKVYRIDVVRRYPELTLLSDEDAFAAMKQIAADDPDANL